MLSRLRHHWERLRAAYWFVPGLMSAGAVPLAFAVVAFDRRIADGGGELPDLLYAAGPEGARALLSAIAASMITVAGVSFSVMIVALTQAANLFGHRLLRNFLRDRGNQLSLGTFLATFVYCTLVLMRVRGSEPGPSFVPHLGVALAVVMALASVGMLIFFLHHATAGLNWGRVIARAGDDLDRALHHAFEDDGGDGPADLDELTGEQSQTVVADAHGYLSHVEEASLLELAVDQDLVIRLHARVGDFVLQGVPLATVAPLRRMPEELAARLRRALPLQEEPESSEDVLLAVDRLVEMALRALSPAVNNPMTAVDCVDRLGVSLSLLAGRDRAARWLADEQGRWRVGLKPLRTREVVDQAFGTLRRHGAGSVRVTLRLLQVTAALAVASRDRQLLAALRRQAELLRREAVATLSLDEDREAVERAFATAEAALDGRAEDGEAALDLRDELLQ